MLAVYKNKTVLSEGALDASQRDGAQDISSNSPKSQNLDSPNISLIAASVVDQKAVLDIGQSSIKVFSVGDLVGSEGLRLVQISDQKAILKSNLDGEMFFVHLKRGDTPSLVQKFSNKLEVEPVTSIAPIMKLETD